MASRIILFYVFAPVADPEAVRLWQRSLAASLGLRGRVIVGPHGINATLGGPTHQLKLYVRGLKEYAPFRRADIKWSSGGADDFPGLSVKVRPELVTFGAPEEIVVGENGVEGGGEHLSPGALHALMAERDDVVMFDGRNAMEAEIGRFKGAVVPEVGHTRDFVAELDSGKYDHLKDKAVVTYCTGGIRCEVLTVLMKNRGFGEVYQMDGGVVRYGESFGDKGLWEGSLYVFDGRMHQEFGRNTVPLGRCERCEQPAATYVNRDDETRDLVLRCSECLAASRTP